ncbi:MAG TPA: HNH endonuclease signature motif containing protein [Anaerolineae bacterium]|nr:HNH endonuclease signature motif containing protein [Anaerolineae bacterium]
MAVSAALRRQIRALDANRCAYCRAPEALSVATFEIDHIVPASADGQTVASNLCLACPLCNRSKGVWQTALDASTGSVVPLFNPRRDTWAAHFAWDDEVVAISGLTPTGRATVLALRMNRPQIVRLRRLWLKIGVQLSD